MRNKKKVTVAIDKNGKMLVDFQGFAGDQCFKEAAKLEEILAQLGVEADINSRVKKPQIPESEGPTSTKEGA